jgi:hypothetical protein
LRLISKSAERNHSNYRRSEQEKYYYRWIYKGLLFQRSNLEAKNKVSSNYFSKSHYYSANYLKEENNCDDRMKRMKLFLLTEEFLMLAYMHYIETVTLLLLMRFAENTFIVKFSFFLPGKKFM